MKSMRKILFSNEKAVMDMSKKLQGVSQAETAVNTAENEVYEPLDAATQQMIVKGLSDDEEETELPQQETSADEKGYTQLFAKICAGIAGVFGTESEFGKRMLDLARGIENDAKAAQDTEADAVNQVSAESDSAGKEDAVAAFASSDGVSKGISRTDVMDADFTTNALPVSQSKFVEMMPTAQLSLKADEMIEQGVFENFAGDGAALQLDRLQKSVSMTMTNVNTNVMGDLSGIDVTDEQRHAIGRDYVDAIRGVETFYQEASLALDEKYADSPDKLQGAKEGLTNFVSTVTCTMYGGLRDADQQYDILSDGMLTELDTMNLPVEATYTDYVAARNEAEGVQSEDDDMLYANAGLLDEPEQEAVDEHESASVKTAPVKSKDVEKSTAEMDAYFSEIAAAYDAQHNVSFEMGE